MALLGSSGCPGPVHVGCTGVAGLPPHVRGTWAVQACLSLSTPFGRRSAGASSSWPSGSSPDNGDVRLLE